MEDRSLGVVKRGGCVGWGVFCSFAISAWDLAEVLPGGRGATGGAAGALKRAFKASARAVETGGGLRETDCRVIVAEGVFELTDPALGDTLRGILGFLAHNLSCYALLRWVLSRRRRIGVIRYQIRLGRGLRCCLRHWCWGGCRRC